MVSPRLAACIVPTLAGLGVLFQPLITPFVFPGLLLFLVADRDWSLSDRVAHMAFASVGFWMASLWPLALVGLPLHWYCHGVTVLCLGAFVWLGLVRGRPVDLELKARDLVVLAVLAVVVWLRLRPMSVSLAPSGADMSMHAYIVRLMVDAAGAPDTYLPLLDLDRFPAFPAGFHTIGALLALLSGQPAWWSAYLASCLSHVLFCTGLYLLGRELVGWREGLVAAMAAAFLLFEPQAMAGWGGNPTVLGLAFLPLVFAVEHRLREGGSRPLAGGLCLLYLLGLFHAHSIVFMQTFYITLPALAAALACGKRPDRGYWKTLAVVAGLFLVANLPFVLRVDFGAIDARTLDWIKNWVRNTSHVWYGSAADALWSIPFYVFHRLALETPVLWGLLALAALGAGRLWFKRRAVLAWALGFVAGAFLLILNCRYWVLPASYLVYPERTAAMVTVPLAVLVAAGLRLVAAFLGREAGRHLWSAALALVMVLGAFYGEAGYTNAVAWESTVAPTDVRAMEWIANNTPPDAIIENNRADAGQWIPAMIGRRITEPQVNIAVLYQVPSVERGGYVFVGAKPVYGEPKLKAEALLKQPDKYEAVYQAGSSFVFRRKE